MQRGTEIAWCQRRAHTINSDKCFRVCVSKHTDRHTHAALTGEQEHASNSFLLIDSNADRLWVYALAIRAVVVVNDTLTVRRTLSREWNDNDNMITIRQPARERVKIKTV